MKPLRPILFIVNNDRDKCNFCNNLGKLVKSMSSGANMCFDCAKYMEDTLKDEPKLLTNILLEE